MATTSDIAFWELLKDKFLCCHPDGPSTWLGVSGNDLKHPGRVLLCCLCLLPVCFLVSSRAPKLPGSCHTSTRVALEALVTVIVPTCSLWPSRYVEVASVLRSHINIPFKMILKDVVDGVVEIRNPSDDLPNLLGPGTTVNGHTIRISMGWRWWIRYFKWWILTETRSGHTFGSFDSLHRNILPITSGPLGLFASPSALAPSTLNSSHCLDYFPRSVFPTMSAGHKVFLEFTTFSPSLRTLSTAQIISALPFMISERPRRQPRSLVSVLEQLTASYGPSVVIDSLLNISRDYQYALDYLYKSSGEQRIRESWSEILGIEAWRRERFLVALEAALVRLGWIERWAVQVTVK